MARPVVGAAKDRQLVLEVIWGRDLVTSHVVREVIERGLDSMERDLSRN